MDESSKSKVVGRLPSDAVRAARPMLSVVVPAYNEAARIERSLDKTLAFLSTRADAVELVVVDDGSRDRTAEVVEAFAREHPAVRLVRLPDNRGKGAAIRAGVAATRGERVLMMDADLATPIEELVALERALDGGAAVATASRAIGTSDVRRAQSALRVLLGRLGNLWIRAWAVPGIHDTQCGFKLFRREVVKELFSRQKLNGFAFDVEILFLAHRLSLPVCEVPVNWHNQEGSKVNLALDSMKMLRDLLKLKFIHKGL